MYGSLERTRFERSRGSHELEGRWCGYEDREEKLVIVSSRSSHVRERGRGRNRGEEEEDDERLMDSIKKGK